MNPVDQTPVPDSANDGGLVPRGTNRASRPPETVPCSPGSDTAVGRARRLIEMYGRHLQQTRKHYGVTLRQLGSDLDVDFTMLSKLEHAAAIPSEEAERKLREWLLQHPLPVEPDVEG